MTISDLLKNIKPKYEVKEGSDYDLYSSITLKDGVINISASIIYHRDEPKKPSKPRLPSSLYARTIDNGRIISPGRIIDSNRDY